MNAYYEKKCRAIANHEARQATESEVYEMIMHGQPSLLKLTKAEIDRLIADYDLTVLPPITQTK